MNIADWGKLKITFKKKFLNGLRSGPPASANQIAENYTVLRNFRLSEYFRFFGSVNIFVFSAQ